MSRPSSAAYVDSKPHYEILDGLRGVAALLVVFYHIFEGLSFAAGGTVITVINHGYLAVDFFFILSGFVIGYAYDDRWGKTLTLGNFFKRRLIRLHPMVVMGTIVGAITFCIQGCVRWDGTQVPVSAVMLALLCGMFFIPAVPGMGRDVRGNGEMFPLNGPSWSLFFEYIGNIIYAVLICRLKTKVLAVLTGILGALYAWFVITDVSGYGNMGVGWTLDSVNFLGGTLRMMFPYATGMLLARNFKPVKVRGAFWICSLVLLLLFIVPYIPSQGGACLNGVFEFFCVAAIFPLLVVLFFDEERWQQNMITTENRKYVETFDDIRGGRLIVDARACYLDPVLEVTWTSDNPDIATVDERGRVQGLRQGTATLTATVRDKNTGEERSTQMLVNVISKL